MTTVETLGARAELDTSAKTRKWESGDMSFHALLPVHGILLPVQLCGVQRDRETLYEVIECSTPHKRRRHITHPVPRCRTFPYGKGCRLTQHPASSVSVRTQRHYTANRASYRLAPHLDPAVHDSRARKLVLRDQALIHRPPRFLAPASAVEPVAPRAGHFEVNQLQGLRIEARP